MQRNNQIKQQLNQPRQQRPRRNPGAKSGLTTEEKYAAVLIIAVFFAMLFFLVKI